MVKRRKCLRGKRDPLDESRGFLLEEWIYRGRSFACFTDWPLKNGSGKNGRLIESLGNDDTRDLDLLSWRMLISRGHIFFPLNNSDVWTLRWEFNCWCIPFFMTFWKYIGNSPGAITSSILTELPREIWKNTFAIDELLLFLRVSLWPTLIRGSVKRWRANQP